MKTCSRQPKKETVREANIPTLIFLFCGIALLCVSNSSAQSVATPSPSPSLAITETVFLASDITTAPFKTLNKQTPLNLCPFKTIQIQRVIEISTNLPLRIPHSSILANSNETCGDSKFQPYNDSASDVDLLADDYISVVPIQKLYTQQAATEANAEAIYYQLYSSNRSYTRTFLSFAKDLIQNNAILKSEQSKIFVGLERYSSRICNGDKTVIPKFTFYFFGLFYNPIQLDSILPYESKVIVPSESAFFISFKPSFNDPLMSEYVCAFNREPPIRTPPPLNLRLCFPSSSKVIMQHETIRNISHLQVGDLVLDASNQFSRVVGFSHRSSSIKVPYSFIKLLFSSAVNNQFSSLTISHKHLLWILKNNSSKSLIYAQDVNVNDILIGRDHGQFKVIHVGEEQDYGLYNPHTASGSLLVNGIAVSCYTGAVSISMAHALLAPVRAVVIAWSWFRTWSMTEFASIIFPTGQHFTTTTNMNEFASGRPSKSIRILKWRLIGTLKGKLLKLIGFSKLPTK